MSVCLLCVCLQLYSSVLLAISPAALRELLDESSTPMLSVPLTSVVAPLGLASPPLQWDAHMVAQGIVAGASSLTVQHLEVCERSSECVNAAAACCMVLLRRPTHTASKLLDSACAVLETESWREESTCYYSCSCLTSLDCVVQRLPWFGLHGAQTNHVLVTA